MKKLLKYHLYIIGFTILIISAAFLNLNCPPNYDEAHAWNIARYLSLTDIFTLSKTEGHPFLWFYILMPIAKTNFLYPYSLYVLNLIFMLGTFYLLYKYAPFPPYLKYLITFSAPFLQLYIAFARSYSLGLLLLFTLLSLYPYRHKKNILYLSLLLLTANTNLACFLGALILGISYFYENIKVSLQNKTITTPTLQIIIVGLIELILIILQFYNYDTDITKHTPTSNTLISDINQALFPLNIYTYPILILISLYIFYKNKKYTALFFLISTQGLLFIIFHSLYHGGIHLHNFFYIYLICSYWISNTTQEKIPLYKTLPLAITAIALIFNPANQYKIADKHYLKQLTNSAVQINKLFPEHKQKILVLEHFDGNIILPYLNNNITLINQNATNYTTLKGFQESLHHMYKRINIYTLTDFVQQNPNLLLFRTCGKPSYYNSNLAFYLRYELNTKYCLYTAEIKDN